MEKQLSFDERRTLENFLNELRKYPNLFKKFKDWSKKYISGPTIDFVTRDGKIVSGSWESKVNFTDAKEQLNQLYQEIRKVIEMGEKVPVLYEERDNNAILKIPQMEIEISKDDKGKIKFTYIFDKNEVNNRGKEILVKNAKISKNYHVEIIEIPRPSTIFGKAAFGLKGSDVSYEDKYGKYLLTSFGKITLPKEKEKWREEFFEHLKKLGYEEYGTYIVNTEEGKKRIYDVRFEDAEDSFKVIIKYSYE